MFKHEIYKKCYHYLHFIFGFILWIQTVCNVLFAANPGLLH